MTTKPRISKINNFTVTLPESAKLRRGMGVSHDHMLKFFTDKPYLYHGFKAEVSIGEDKIDVMWKKGKLSVISADVKVLANADNVAALIELEELINETNVRSMYNAPSILFYQTLKVSSPHGYFEPFDLDISVKSTHSMQPLDDHWLMTSKVEFSNFAINGHCINVGEQSVGFKISNHGGEVEIIYPKRLQDLFATGVEFSNFAQGEDPAPEGMTDA